MWSEPEAAVSLRRQDSSERWEAFAAFEGETMVGVGIAEFPLLDNTDKLYFHVDAAPGLRRRGIGTSLVAHVVDRAKTEGRSVLIGEAHYPIDAGEDHPYRRFAAACGFDLANREMHRALELPVPDETIQGWVDECAPHHEGYGIETYVDDFPDVLLPSYVQLLNQLVLDAPTGDIDFEEEALTVDGFKERQAKLEEQGRTIYVPNLYQWATLVARAHRGHRLGLATKARNLREVQNAHPDRTMVHTSNSDANGPMVAINERIGFRPVEVNAEFQRKL